MDLNPEPEPSPLSPVPSPDEQKPVPAIPPIPWTVRDVWLGVASIVLWFGVVILLQFITIKLKLDLGVLVSLSEVLLLVPVSILALGKYRVGWNILGLRRFKAQAVGIGCGLMVVFYSCNLAYSLFLSLFNLRVQTDITPIFTKLPSPVWFLIGGAIIAPVVEEIFFRGFVFGGLRTRYNFPVAALISALLFGLVHLEWTAILPITLLGLIFAFLYERSGSIWPGILMHFLTNACSLSLALYLSQHGFGG